MKVQNRKKQLRPSKLVYLMMSESKNKVIINNYDVMMNIFEKL